MPPFVGIRIDGERRKALWALRDDDLGAALVQLRDDPVGVERLVGDEAVELDPLDERGDADGVVALTGQQDKANEIAECVGQRQDLGRQAAARLADGLALSPPFAP